MNGFDVAALLLFCLGTGSFFYYRHVSRVNFFLRRAPQLKISELHTFDDAWITGLIEAPNIVVPPFFGYETTYYNYTLSEKKVKYERDSNGNERRVEYWEVVRTDTNSTPFFIKDGTGSLMVDPKKGIIKYPHSDTYSDGWWMHNLSYFPSSGLASSVGVLTESKDQLTAKGEVPLMITPMGRKNFMQAIKLEERFAKYGALAATWAAFSTGFAGIFEHASIGRNLSGEAEIIIFSFLGLIPFAAFYYQVTYNSLVQLRQKIINSWSNVDIELKLRRDLIPLLVDVSTAYMGHENQILIQLSALREQLAKEQRLGEKVRIENEISLNLASVTLVTEKLPNLKNEVLTKLQQELSVLENKVAHAKSHYNAVTEEYNSLVEGFPAKWIAAKHLFVSVPFYGINSEDVAKQSQMVSKPKLAPVEMHRDLTADLPPKAETNNIEKKEAA